MDRREALKRSSLMLGFAITAGTAAAVLNGCKAEPSLDWKPKNLSLDQIKLVSEISDIILPKTDTPGAIDAQVDRFVDSMLESYSSTDRETFLNALKSFDAKAEKLHKKKFVECASNEKIKVMDAMVADSKGKGKTSPFFLLREATIVGFCTSEIGAKEFLKYDPVPGPYQGCVDLNSIGAAWAL